MGKWVIQYDPDARPVRWQCARCESPIGQPHKDGCKCTLVEGVEIEEWPHEISVQAVEGKEK